MTENVAIPVHDASLPGCFGKELCSALGKPDTSIRNDQPNAHETSLLEVVEECAPARFVLLRSLADAENLPITIAVHPDR
jgi:hypothetical protein